MTKVKTSIYIDKDLWNNFKKYASKNGVEVSKMLEELIKDSLIEIELNKAFAEISESYEIDFEPLKPKEGPISDLIRVMRNERANSISRQ